MDLKKSFLKYQAQTTPHPIALEISYAKGSYLYDKKGKAYLDFAAGVSANTLGHSHPKIISAIKKQLDAYMHVMVYGEFIQRPCVDLCKKLAFYTPKGLESTYLVNSGTEAIEGAMKLAKRYTARHEVIACENAYHGNTQGALSLMGNIPSKQAFLPLLPGIRHIRFNNTEDLEKITEQTACVLLESIQGSAGFILPEKSYLGKVKKRCQQTGSLMILDEIQPGFGRTGKLFAFEHDQDAIPDVLVMGKGMGGGMPIGAFMSSEKIMNCLSHDPMLGHITTFGGHPVIAASALATLEELVQGTWMKEIPKKEELFRKLLVHKEIKSIQGRGLMLACKLKNKEYVLKIAQACLKKGLIVFWLLFSGDLRISPPLTISLEEIYKGCCILLECLDENPSIFE